MRWDRCWRGVVVLAWTVWALCAGAVAQPYPGKPVRVIVPFAAGGTPDVVGRIISQQLTAQTGQTFVVENRSGADGVVGAQTVAEAPPDGYTLLVTSSSFVVNPSFHKKLPFDVIRDFEPVSNIAATEAYILGINPRLPVRSVPELIALTRGGDNQISFGSPGVGNGLHLAAELFKSLTKTQMVHVPYRGAAPAITGLIAGDVQVMFMTPPSSLPFRRGRQNPCDRLYRRQALRAPSRRADTGRSWRARDGGALQLDRHVRAGQDISRGAGAAPRGNSEGDRDRGIPRPSDRDRCHSGRQRAGRVQAVRCGPGQAGRRYRAGGRHRAAVSPLPEPRP